MAAEAAAAWLRLVEIDLATARLCSQPAGFIPESAAYHCQQAAEKLIKAGLILRDVEPPRTHDLEALWAILPMDVPGRDDMLSLVNLTFYAIAFRYPPEADATPLPTREELQSWIGRIDRIRTWLAAATVPGT